MKTHRTSPSLLFAAMLVAAPFHADAARVDYQVDLGLERNDNVLMSSTDPADSSAPRAGFGFLVTEETSVVQANFSGQNGRAHVGKPVAKSDTITRLHLKK